MVCKGAAVSAWSWFLSRVGMDLPWENTGKTASPGRCSPDFISWKANEAAMERGRRGRRGRGKRSHGKCIHSLQAGPETRYKKPCFLEGYLSVFKWSGEGKCCLYHYLDCFILYCFECMFNVFSVLSPCEILEISHAGWVKTDARDARSRKATNSLSTHKSIIGPRSYTII